MAQQSMPWEEYQSTTPATGQGVVIPVAPKDMAAESRAQTGTQINVSEEARAGRKEQFEVAKNLRDEVRKAPESVNYETVIRQFSSALDAKPTPTGDQLLITAYAKMLDPASVVREAEFNIVQAGDSAIGRRVAQLQKEFGLDESGLIRPEVRNRVLTEMRNLVNNYRQSYDRVRTDYEGLAGNYGIDPKLVLGSRIDAPYDPKIEKAWAAKGIDPNADVQMGISGGEAVSTEQDLAIAQATNQAFAQGGSLQDIVAAAQAAGAQVGPDDIANIQAAIEARAKGQSVTFNPQKTGQRSPIAQAAGEALMTPAGTALTGAVNAAGVGLLSQFAGDQVQGLEALNPKSAIGGELVGSMLGTAGLAKGAGAALSMAAPGLAGRLAGGGLAGAVGREALTEGAYGGLYAGNTGQDIGTGFALGAAGSLGGQALAAGARRAAPVVSGMFRRGGDVPPDGGVPPAGGMPTSGAPTGGVPSPMAASMAGETAAVDDAFIPRTVRFGDAGASASTGDNIRAQRAQELPVPIELARFQRSRLFEEQQRARELAKNNEVGGPIRARLAEQQEALRQNFDRFIDETGSEVWENAREKGVVVDQALKKLADVGKARIRVLYKRAEKAGELAEPVDMTRLADELNGLRAERTSAPVIKGLADELDVRELATGSLEDGTLKFKRPLTLNEAEELRKKINRIAKQNDPNDLRVAGELKDLIDNVTEGAGGDLYKQARSARVDYRKTFEDAALVKRLMGTKPGTTDRQVALEKVAEQAIYSGGASLDDIKALKGVLDQASTRGQRAWRELQGATLEHIRDQAYKGITTDESGQRVLNARNLDTVITNLDRAGKLDYVLGRQTANLLRTINDVAKDVVTAPPGSVNASGTSSAALNAMDTLATFGLSGLPIPAGKLLGGLKSTLQNRGLRKEVKRLLD
jgi:hypothetical protein